eukprot:gene13930-14047_t
MTAEQKLAELGLTLPSPAAPLANYVGFVQSGNLLFISGQLAFNAEGQLAPAHTGKLGDDVAHADGIAAARLCAVNVLAQAKTALGSLERINRCIKLGGFVNVAPGFTAMPAIMNGASDLMVAVLGDKGCLMSHAPEWLVRRPIAHRGLHNKNAGIVENSVSAAKAAITLGFAIECDIQRSADGEAMVFHDEGLERLTGQAGLIETVTSAELRDMELLLSSDRIPSLAEFLDLINGQVPLICEIKSGFNGDTRLVERALDITKTYTGPLAFKSFDPDMLRRLRALSCTRPVGIVAESVYDDHEWDILTPTQKRDMANLVHYPETRPDFLSFWVRDLPSTASTLFKHGLNLPVMTWTVRTDEQRAHAQAHADQMVFEGFIP